MAIEHYANAIIEKDPVKNIQRRMGFIRKGFADKAYAAKLWLLCKRNPLFFINYFCYILETRTSKVLPFITHPSQDKVLLALEDSVGKCGVVVPKGRDEGISTTGMAFTLWRCLFYEHQAVLLVSQKQELVYDRGNMDALFSKIEFMLTRLPSFLIDTGYKYTELHMGFPMTDSTIDGVSSAAHTGTGRRKTFIWFDEFAKVPEAREIFVDTASVSNSRFFCSTHYGRNTKFYELTQDPSFLSVNVHWTENPLHNKDMYRAGKDWPFEWRSPWSDRMWLELGKNKSMYAQEIEIDPQKADTQFFDQELIDEAMKHCTPPLRKGRIENVGGQPRFIDDPNGFLELWIDLKHGMPRYEAFAVGADIAAGSGATPSCISVISCLTGRKVAAFASAGIVDYKFAELCWNVARFFNSATFGWERSGMAAGFSKAFMEFRYHNVWWNRSGAKGIKPKLSDTPGWQPTRESKVEAGRVLAGAYATGRFKNPCKESVQDLANFTLTATGAMEYAPSLNTETAADARENHGDRVIADMVAWMVAAEHMLSIQPKAAMTRQEQTIEDLRQHGLVLLGPKKVAQFDIGPRTGYEFK